MNDNNSSTTNARPKRTAAIKAVEKMDEIRDWKKATKDGNVHIPTPINLNDQEYFDASAKQKKASGGTPNFPAGSAYHYER